MGDLSHTGNGEEFRVCFETYDLPGSLSYSKLAMTVEHHWLTEN